MYWKGVIYIEKKALCYPTFSVWVFIRIIKKSNIINSYTY